MARVITSDELNLLRSDGQWSKLYLAIFKPNTIYTAHLGTPPVSNDLVYQIAFTSGSGTLGDVKANMSLLVGTSAGADDLGKGMCRLRKAPISGTFYIGLVSGVRWDTAGTIYLTVVDDFDLHAKHAIDSGGTLLMDVDTAYSNQHSAFNPVPVLGSHAVAWLDESTVDVEFDASESWVIGSSISGYAWTAPGASASSGMSTATPTITYDTPGCYSVYCTVTAANAKTTTSVRHVFVYDRADNPPATVFQLSQCIGDHDTGGWMFDMTMEAEASLSEIRDRALVVLFAEDWYGIPPTQTKQSIGPLENRENIVCVGRIMGESIRWDRETGQVHFTVQGPHYWLNKIQAFPIDLSFAGIADVWSEMPYLTVDRALFHILYWHSTAIETMDFYPTNDTLYTVDAKSIATKIWGQLNDIAVSKLMAFPGVDRLGRLFIEIDPNMAADDARDFPVVMDLTSDDWQESVEFQRDIVKDCSLISLNAEQTDAGGNALTRYSYSPGRVPFPYGEPEMPNKMLCSSQADSNHKAGRIMGWRLNEYPDVPVNFAMNNRMIDIVPRQFCGFTVSEENSPRGVAFDIHLIPRRVSLFHDGDSGFEHVEVEFEGETFEMLSTDGDIPGVDLADIATPSLPGLSSLPPLGLEMPGFPDAGGGSSSVGPRKMLFRDPTIGLFYTTCFNIEKPIYQTCNSGLTTGQYQSIQKCVEPPLAKSIFVAHLGHGTITNSFLARAPYAGAPFEVMLDHASMGNVGLDVVYVAAVCCNPLAYEEMFVLLSYGGDHCRLYKGSGSDFSSYVLKSSFTFNVGSSSCELSYGNGKLLLTNGDFMTLSADGVPDGGSGSIGPQTSKHVRATTSGKTLHYPDDDELALGAGNCASIVTGVGNVTFKSGSSAFFIEEAFAMDPTGYYVMGRRAAGTPVKSPDGGSTWVTNGVSYLVPTEEYKYAYISGVGVGSCWVAAGYRIWYFNFEEDIFIDKTGNAHELNPFLACDIVKVLEI